MNRLKFLLFVVIKKILGMLLTPMQYDARCLNQAMKGIGSSDDDVIGEILCARPNGYLEQLKEVYEERYGNPLMEDIENNCRREFERFMLAILCCAREEGLDAIDEDQAAEDAQELFDVRFYSILNQTYNFPRLEKSDGSSPTSPSSPESALDALGCRSGSSTTNIKR